MRTKLTAIAALAAAAITLTAAASAGTAPAKERKATQVRTSADDELAWNLVMYSGDSDVFPANSLGHFPRRCLTRTGFPTTARASMTFGFTREGAVSVATVFKTKAEARRYYRGAVGTMSRCLGLWWRRGSDPPSVGPARALGFPLYGNTSAAWRLSLTFPSAPEPYTSTDYTNDWVMVRKRRAVLTDVFALPAGWTEFGITSFEIEEQIVSTELARAFP